MHARILLVDDDEANLATLEAILSPEGYELHTAASGPEAITAASRLNPDLILLDVMMPGMDGFSVCRRIRSAPTTLRRIPILMLTALQDQQSRIEGIRAGADDFVSKPCPFEELRARVRTITELNRYRAIAEQSTRFQRLFELTPSPIALTDSAGRIVALNAHATRLLTPLVRTPVIGRQLIAGLPDTEANQLSELIRRAAENQPPDRPVQLRLEDTGGPRVFHVRATRLEESESLRILLVLDDVTAEVRAREDAEALNTRLEALVQARTLQLEQANQILLSYAAFVAHDLRSPLSAMKGYVSLLLDDRSPLPDDARCLAESAGEATAMMEEMITNILKLAAEEHHAQGPSSLIDPKPVIDRLCWKLSGLSQQRPAITIAPLPRVGASATLIERIFFNLIANALKYSANQSQPRIAVGSIPHPGGPVLFVRDNGVGFSAADADRLFQDFSRLPTAGESEGLGLGLSLISRLVRAHQGRIWAESQPGEGATFFVQFPAAPTPPAAPATPAEATPSCATV